VLVGNKADKARQRQVKTEEGMELAAKWNCAYVECSAKLNENIETVFTTLMGEIEKATAPPPPESKCAIL
jgi:Ras family protein